MTRAGLRKLLGQMVRVKHVAGRAYYVEVCGWSVGASGWNYAAALKVRRDFIDRFVRRAFGEAEDGEG